jgi:3-hydroxy acid dehydrogenase / malonic semialdehyde reductase
MSRIYILTGASRGIGRAIAEKLIAKGDSVVGIGRKFEWESPLLRQICLDLSDLTNLPKALESLKKEVGSINGIICSAGRGRFGSLEEFSYAQIRELVDLNFLSQVYLIKAFLPLLKEKKEGDILVIGSESALNGKRRGSIYCSSKFALRGFCQALREECASSSIRVTLINPGMVKTAFFDTLSFSCGEEPNEHLLPEDVAEIALHVLTSRAGTVFDEINLSPQKKKLIFN